MPVTDNYDQHLVEVWKTVTDLGDWLAKRAEQMMTRMSFDQVSDEFMVMLEEQSIPEEVAHVALRWSNGWVKKLVPTEEEIRDFDSRWTFRQRYQEGQNRLACLERFK